MLCCCTTFDVLIATSFGYCNICSIVFAQNIVFIPLCCAPTGCIIQNFKIMSTILDYITWRGDLLLDVVVLDLSLEVVVLLDLLLEVDVLLELLEEVELLEDD